MLLFKPGQRVSVRHLNQGAFSSAILLEVSEHRMALELFSDMDLRPGDPLKVDIAQQQDALYIIDTRVLNVEEKNCALEVLGDPMRLQRRQSERIPTRLQAQYLLMEGEEEQEQGYQEGVIMDISMGGALLNVSKPLDLFSELMLYFEIFTGKSEILTTGMSGKIVREHRIAQNDKYSYGIAFNSPLNLLSG